MSSASIKYVVITPVRDEEDHLSSTIECMLQQTVLPQEWVIVNDGSSDGTGKIIDDYASRFTWIKALHRKDRGFRKAGGGVVKAFNDGYCALTCSDWEFIVKFDGDLTFDSSYFAACLENFGLDKQLGIGGGMIYYDVDGEKQFEKSPKFHVRGATKIYRRACWEGIGGLISEPGWDTFDEIKANSMGWTTRTFPHLHLLHQRLTGSADGMWRTLVKYGRANYVCGYHPLFMLSKCVVRLVQRPYLLGSIGIAYGFFSGYLMKIWKVEDREAIKYLRQQQLRRLIGRASIWD